jgi:hypothetical protein
MVIRFGLVPGAVDRGRCGCNHGGPTKFDPWQHPLESAALSRRTLKSDIAACPKSANSGLMHCSKSRHLFIELLPSQELRLETEGVASSRLLADICHLTTTDQSSGLAGSTPDLSGNILLQGP